MKNRLKNINFYLTAISVWSSIDATSNTWTFVVDAVSVGWYQLYSWSQLFWVVVDANLENNKELFRITNVDLWTKTLTFDKRTWPNGKKAHTATALVQINDVAEIFNHIANTIDDFWMAEVDLDSPLDVNVFGWEVRSNWVSATIADTTVTFTDNQALWYLVFDYVTNTFKEVTTIQSNHALLYEVTTLWWVITSFVDKRWLSFGISTASAVPVFADETARDAAIPSPSDWMSVCLVSEWVYTDYLNWAWIARWSNATPNASETVSWKTQIATQSEVNAGTDTGSTLATLVVTPAKLAANITSKIASQAEAEAWTDDTKLMTPLKTQQAIDVNALDIASVSDVVTWTDNIKYITPSVLNDINYWVALTASVNLKSSADTVRTSSAGSYTKIKETKMWYYPNWWTVRVSFDLKSTSWGYTVYGKVYKNWSAIWAEHSTSSTSYQSYSDDIAATSQDLIQLYVYQGSWWWSTLDIRNFRISYDVTKPTISTTVITD